MKNAMLIFPFAKDFSPAVNSTLPFFIAFFINFMTLSDILYIFD